MIKRAFTLIEMLTVIAITAILLTIIVYPLIQSFDLTHMGEAFANAQDQGRRLAEQVSREINNAVTVRAQSNLIGTTLNVPIGSANNANLPNGSVVVQVPANQQAAGNVAFTIGGEKFVDVDLPYTKMDLIPPAQGQYPGSIGTSGFINPISGKIDPTLKAPKGQFSTPVAPAMNMVRYWVGLRDPFSTYNDPYTGLLMLKSGSRDNLYVLWRASFVADLAGTTQGNTALFAAGANNSPTLDDPRFFVADRQPDGTIIQDDHNLRIYHWMGQTAPWEGNDPIKDNPTNFAHAVIQTQVSRYDMIAPQYNLQTRNVTFDGNIPRLTPCIQFRPTVIGNDPTAGQEALRPGEETENAAAIAPDVYKTEYGLWNTAIVRTYPEGFLQSDPNRDQYIIGYTPQNSPPLGFAIYYYDPAFGAEFTSGVELFDDYTYSLATANNEQYPFTQAAMSSNSRSNWLNNPSALLHFLPYNVLSGTGKIVASFDVSEVGVNSLSNEDGEDPNRPNLPTLWLPDSYGPFTPNDDPDYNSSGGGWTGAYPWSPAGASLWTPNNSSVMNAYDINEAFNQAWDTHTDLQPNIQRFIDLRVVPNEDGTYSPLYPGQIPGTVTGFLTPQPNGSTLSRCRVVPGSEVVYGPDQNPGSDYGHPIRYTRTTHNPGPDQYRINYVDQPEPSDPVTGLVSASSYENNLGLTASEVSGFTPAAYDPTNFCSATIQARYKAGYIELNSDPTLPLPNGYQSTSGFVPVPFKTDYRFQFTGTVPATSVEAGAGTSDVFACEYDTRQLMQVLLTIRNYPQSSTPNSQSITLKATAAIRNYAR